MESESSEEEKKIYRKYLRPGFKPSMVSSQTENKWKRRRIDAQSSLQNQALHFRNPQRKLNQ